MKTFEFQAQPKDGRIEIPVEYQDQIVGTVRVLVFSQEQTVGAAEMVNRLLEHPLEIESFTPMTREEIYERH